MSIWRLQAVLPYTSNLPEDVSTNTIYIDTDLQSSAEEAAEMFSHFYTEGHDGNDPVGEYIGPIVTRDTDACQIKAYDMSDTEPRPLKFTYVFQLPTGATYSLPYEVAVVHSFAGDPPFTARRRGRNYIGPLGVNALPNGTVPVPKAEFVSAIVASADVLQAELAAVDAPWVVHSSFGTDTPVTRGWVDNDFDTQRRRGMKASARTLWI